MANNKEYTFDDYLNEQLKDPEFRKEWDALEPAYKFKELRIRKCISQADLAKKLHTRQPSIARLESGQGIRNLTQARSRSTRCRCRDSGRAKNLERTVISHISASEAQEQTA